SLISSMRFTMLRMFLKMRKPQKQNYKLDMTNWLLPSTLLKSPYISILTIDRVLHPTADTFVRGGASASTNYGDAEILEVKFENGRPDMTRVAFLKFDLSDFASVEWAVLRLYAGFSDQL